MIWWLLGGFWVGFLCGIVSMAIFVAGARGRTYVDRAAEERERLEQPFGVSVTSHARSITPAAMAGSNS